MNEKKENRFAGVITLAVVAALVLIDLFAFKNSLASTYFLPVVCPLICGFVLLFARIKSYGWAITLSVLMALLIHNVMETDIDAARVLLLCVASVVSFAMLLSKNLKKSKQQ